MACIMKPVQVRLCKQRVDLRRTCEFFFRSCVVPCLRSRAVRMEADALLLPFADFVFGSRKSLSVLCR